MSGTTSYFQRVASVRDKLENVTDPRFKKDVKRYLSALLQQRPFFTPQMRQFQNRVLEKFEALLLAWPDLEDAMETWRKKPQAERLCILRGFQVALAGFQSECGIEVRPVPMKNRADKSFMGMAIFDFGESGPALDHILLNMDDGQMRRSFSASLGVMVHEQTHIMQFALARAAKYDLIDPAHPLYRDACLIRDIWDTDSYLEYKKIKDHGLYYRQPLEAHCKHPQSEVERIVWQARNNFKPGVKVDEIVIEIEDLDDVIVLIDRGLHSDRSTPPAPL